MSKQSIFIMKLVIIFNTFMSMSFAQPNTDLKTLTFDERLYAVKLLNSRFYKKMPLENLDMNYMYSCKVELVKICGEFDFPSMFKITNCINDKFDKINAKRGCGNIAHALAYSAFIAGMPQKSEECAPITKKCLSDYQKKISKKAPLICLAQHPSAAPGCVLTSNLALNYRRNLAKKFDSRLIAE